jgi:hypothetical protein
MVGSEIAPYALTVERHGFGEATMTDTDPCEICGTQAETVSTGGYDGISELLPGNRTVT